MMGGALQGSKRPISIRVSTSSLTSPSGGIKRTFGHWAIELWIHYQRFKHELTKKKPAGNARRVKQK
jgi:hypothetical protein